MRTAALLALLAAGSFAFADPPSDAFLAAQAKADLGDAASEYSVGLMLSSGNGTTPDYAEGMKWLQKAAAQNYPPAAAAIGFLYQSGIGVPKDPAKAFALYLQSAKLGDAYGERQTAEGYVYGNGVAKDLTAALHWDEAAAAQGDPVGQVRLGIAYVNGAGVPADDKQAFAYFLSAAYDNLGWGQYSVGRCYHFGIFVHKDDVQAYKWLKLARSSYQDSAELDLLLTVSKALKIEQLAEGEKLVQNWPRERLGDAQSDAFQAQFTTGQATTFPFEYKLFHILIPVELNGKTFHFLVDTGAGATMVNEAVATQLGLTGTSYSPMRGLGAKVALSTISKDNSLKLPGLTLDHVSLYAGSLNGFTNALQMPVDGIIGLDVLKRFVVHIDYAGKTISLADAQAFQSPPADAVLALTNSFPPYILAKVVNNGVISPEAKLEIDCGADDAICLGLPFVSANENLGLSGGLKMEGYGIGGGSMGRMTTCSQLLLAGITMPNVAAWVLPNTTGGLFSYVSGYIGNDLLHRFDVTMDFPHQKMYLKKNAAFDEPYNTSKTGLSVALQPDQKTLYVVDIAANTPAAVAGFRSNDVLVAIDGVSLDTLTQEQARDRFRSTGDHHVVVRRNGQPVNLELVMPNPHGSRPQAAATPALSPH